MFMIPSYSDEEMVLFEVTDKAFRMQTTEPLTHIQLEYKPVSVRTYQLVEARIVSCNT